MSGQTAAPNRDEKNFSTEKPKPEKNVSIEEPKVVKNEASMYLNEKFSDIFFLIGEEKLPAHKAILAAKSKRFGELFDENSEKKEITISEITPEAFKLFLQYIYTDIITIPSDIKLFLQELILAHQYSVTELESAMIRKINTNLDVKNVCFFLNGANDNDLDELRTACYTFMDDNALQILSSDSFNYLTQKSMIQILKRDTFMAPEIEIFKSIAKWCERNDNSDNLVLECVRLSSLTVSEIVAIVWPTKLVNSEKLLEIIAEIVGKSSEGLPSMNLVMDKNMATLENGAKAVTELNGNELLNDNRDVNKSVNHVIDSENGIIISLKRPYLINHIRMMLCDADDRYYSYYIETSLDRKKWHKVVDYSRYACRSVQNLYFNEQVSEYIKVVGTSNSKGNEFHLVYLEALYADKIPKIVNGVICPDQNVATSKNKAVVIQGQDPDNLLDGNFQTYAYHSVIAGVNLNSLVIQLAQPYVISSMQLFLYDSPVRDPSYKYFIETSENGTDWEIVIDRRDEECHSWQDLHFPEKLVVFIKITGTYCPQYYYSSFFSAIRYFRCIHFECPSGGKK